MVTVTVTLRVRVRVRVRVKVRVRVRVRVRGRVRVRVSIASRRRDPDEPTTAHVSQRSQPPAHLPTKEEEAFVQSFAHSSGMLHAALAKLRVQV